MADIINNAQFGVDENGNPKSVAGAVNQLTSTDSPIIQQGRTRALQKMNDRGLLNSSMAQTASDSAAYDAAIPIATADLGNQNQKLIQTNQQANQAYQTTMSAINNIQNNNQMDAATKSKAISSAIASANDHFKTLSTVSGLNLPGMLDWTGYGQPQSAQANQPNVVPKTTATTANEMLNPNFNSY